MVDDSTLARTGTVMKLGQLGVPAEAVAAGREALDLISDTSYMLVLMDEDMPEMNGRQCTKLIRIWS